MLLIFKERTTGENMTEMFKMETLGKLGLGLGFSKGKGIFYSVFDILLYYFLLSSCILLQKYNLLNCYIVIIKLNYENNLGLKFPQFEAICLGRKYIRISKGDILIINGGIRF